MPNDLKIADLLVEKTLYHFKDINTFLAPNVYNNDFEEYLYYSNTGFFSGNSLRFRLPNLFDVQEGWTITYPDVVERTESITLGEPINVPVVFRSDEATTQISLGDKNAEVWAERIARPIAASLMASLNTKIALLAEQSIYNFVGDATSDITTSNVFYEAGSMLSMGRAYC
jgi:hypothetical protein